MDLKRSTLEIHLEVLRVIEKGTCKPTRIMYSTNLAWNPLIKILKSLLQQGLIQSTKKANRERFEITDKSRTTLSHFKMALDNITIV